MSTVIHVTIVLATLLLAAQGADVKQYVLLISVTGEGGGCKEPQSHAAFTTALLGA